MGRCYICGEHHPIGESCSSDRSSLLGDLTFKMSKPTVPEFDLTPKVCTCMYGRDSGCISDRIFNYDWIVRFDLDCPVHGRRAW